MILAIDSGTTTTRAWIVDGDNVRAGASASAGVRDVARGRDRSWLVGSLQGLIEEVLAKCQVAWSDVEALVAFGMITSELGLDEVPHLTAPASPADLAAAMYETHNLPDVPVPTYLVPGVRTDGELARIDVMRGEETELVGLLSLDVVQPPLLYVSAGSHAKFVAVDERGRIVWSFTTLSGELLWALSRETILAQLLRPSAGVTDLSAVDEGARCVTRAGLSRALFAARLLHTVKEAPMDACSDFLHGAVAKADLLSLGTTVGHRDLPRRVVIGSGRGLASAYEHLFQQEDWAEEVRLSREPLGALGTKALYRARQKRPAREEG